MDSSQLDLSKFAKIVPLTSQQQKAEVEKRSQGITTIKTIMENLIKAMQSYLVDLQELDSQATYLEQQKAELVEIDKQVRFAHSQLEIKEKQLDAQSKYIEKWNSEHKEQ